MRSWAKNINYVHLIIHFNSLIQTSHLICYFLNSLSEILICQIFSLWNELFSFLITCFTWWYRLKIVYGFPSVIIYICSTTFNFLRAAFCHSNWQNGRISRISSVTIATCPGFLWVWTLAIPQNSRALCSHPSAVNNDNYHQL